MKNSVCFVGLLLLLGCCCCCCCCLVVAVVAWLLLLLLCGFFCLIFCKVGGEAQKTNKAVANLRFEILGLLFFMSLLS